MTGKRRALQPLMSDHSTLLVSTLIGRLGDALEARRDPARAEGMAAYMRHQFAFLGIAAPERALLFRQVTRGLPRPTEADLAAAARWCWERSEREYQYFAVTYLRKHVRRCSAEFVHEVARLITTRSWWDTVDELAQHVVGPLVATHPELRREMDRWIAAENLWLVRSAILHQLGYRERTDAECLFAYCLQRAHESDFFVRKAIGWALREYSKVAPAAVEHFVAQHEAALSDLSRREALKWLRR